MKPKLANIIIIVCFAVITSGLMLSNLFTPSLEFSFAERRKLTQLPQFTSDKLLSGDFFEDFEKYFLDQFVMRDAFRGLKAYVKLYLLGQMDNNNLYVQDGHIIKIEHPLSEQSIVNAASRFNQIYEKYLKGSNVYYSVIPDKNYFSARQKGYLSLDYERMIELLRQNVSDMEYVDIFPELTLEDYYKTDIHWSQEKIVKIADKFLKAMGMDFLASEVDYTCFELSPFYGSYYGQAGLIFSPDRLVYLSSPVIDNAVVFDYETKLVSGVYTPESFDGVDPYDVFLSGAKALITIDNPMSEIEKELVIFRDSFASSITPLLLEGYSKITMIDLRYITTERAGKLAEFKPGSDVLFLYGTQVLNNSAMLR